MTMKFKCPYCARECDYLEIRMEKDILTVIKTMPLFGRHAALVWAYAELFGITPMRAKAKKIRVLMEEIKNLFESEAFVYNRRRYRISAQGIVEALGVIVHRRFEDPLVNHNYLMKIMITIAEREAREASKKAEADLRNKENQLRNVDREDEAPEMNPEIRKQVDRFLGRSRDANGG